MVFYQPQVAEEKLKAELILSDSAWRPLIDKAEAHGYFTGQIDFLLEFSGAHEHARTLSVSEWDDVTHSEVSERI